MVRAGDGGENTHTRRGQGESYVILQRHNAAHAHATRQVDFEQGNGRTRNPTDNRSHDVEILERTLKLSCRRSKLAFVRLRRMFGMANKAECRQREAPSRLAEIRPRRRSGALLEDLRLLRGGIVRRLLGSDMRALELARHRLRRRRLNILQQHRRIGRVHVGIVVFPGKAMLGALLPLGFCDHRRRHDLCELLVSARFVDLAGDVGNEAALNRIFHAHYARLRGFHGGILIRNGSGFIIGVIGWPIHIDRCGARPPLRDMRASENLRIERLHRRTRARKIARHARDNVCPTDAGGRGLRRRSVGRSIQRRSCSIFALLLAANAALTDI